MSTQCAKPAGDLRTNEKILLDTKKVWILLLLMPFEFDSGKNAANKQKHGLDFVQAQELWADPNGLSIAAKSETEPRFALIAKLEGKLWTALFTRRAENIRLLSVRRSRKEEERLYHES
jgi:hypothetical protein